MADHLTVSPEQLRQAAQRPRNLEARITATLKTLQQTLTAAGPAWGNDSFGDKFAKGEKGYLAANDNLTKGAENMAKTFGAIAEGQEEAANHLDGQQSDSTDEFGRRRA